MKNSQRISQEVIDCILVSLKIIDGKLHRLAFDRTWKLVDNKVCHDGRCRLNVMRLSLLYERVIWILHTGQDFAYGQRIDHIDGDTHNKNIDNLIAVSNRSNMQDRYKHRKGRLGGCVHSETSGRWHSQLRINGPKIFLGSCDTEEEANHRYLLAIDHLDDFIDPVQFRQLLTELESSVVA